MKTKILLLISLFCVCGTNDYAQKQIRRWKITGSVIDADAQPVVNAIIMIDGKNTNVVTNQQGNYKIKVRSNTKKLGILSFGNGFIEENIDGRTEIDFRFRTISTQVSPLIDSKGDDAVDLGYDYTKNKYLSNSVAVFDPKKSKRTYLSIYEMIEELPGINQKAFHLGGSVPPTIIVNGVEVSDISYINPIDVESIVFLRDSGAAIYGTRAFGGVIVIKTKKTE